MYNYIFALLTQRSTIQFRLPVYVTYNFPLPGTSDPSPDLHTSVTTRPYYNNPRHQLCPTPSTNMPDIARLLKDTMDQARAMHDKIDDNDLANKETKDLLGDILKSANIPKNSTPAQLILDAKDAVARPGAGVPLPNGARLSPPAAPDLREKCAFENSALLPADEYPFSIQILSWTLAKLAVESGEWFAHATDEATWRAKEEYLKTSCQMITDIYPLLQVSIDSILNAIKELREERLRSPTDRAAAYDAYIATLSDQIAALKGHADFSGKEIDGEDLHTKLVERTVRSLPKYLKERNEHQKTKSELAERVKAEAVRVYRWQF